MTPEEFLAQQEQTAEGRANLARIKRAMSTLPSAAAIQRANELLDRLLPKMTSHDQALDNLYLLTPEATPDLRLAAIAAALYVLREALDYSLANQRPC